MILISDISFEHAVNISKAIKKEIYVEPFVSLANDLEADLLKCVGLNIPILVRSMTGAMENIEIAKKYYPRVLCVFPAGSNEFTNVFSLEIPQPALITGAGDEHNETGYNIEFFAPDEITVEPDYSSFSNGTIAGQIAKIMNYRNCGHWEARYCARMTSSRNGNWDEKDGYGLIDVNAAIVYSKEIAPDPFVEKTDVDIELDSLFYA